MSFFTSFISILTLFGCHFIVSSLWRKKTNIPPVNSRCKPPQQSKIIATHTNGLLSWFSWNGPVLDRRQAATAARAIAGRTVRTDKHCRSSSRPQLQRPRCQSGFKVLLAKMLIAKVRIGCGNPLHAGALDLLLPFPKLFRVLGEFKQGYAIFGSFSTSISHAVVRHPRSLHHERLSWILSSSQLCCFVLWAVQRKEIFQPAVGFLIFTHNHL